MKKYMLVIEEDGFIVLSNMTSLDRASGSMVISVLGPLRVEMDSAVWTDPLHGREKEVLRFAWSSDYQCDTFKPEDGDWIGYPYYEFARRINGGRKVQLIPITN
ncbi:MAG: hypothetical protein ABIJ23_03435 [Candidatus Magasanikbacteria bacterium]